MAAILKWMFVLVLLIVVAGGGAAYWLYARSDEGLRLLVLEQLKSSVPTLKFSLARAQFDTIGCVVKIYGLTVHLPDDNVGHPSLEIPEIIATLDSDPLTNFNNVVVQKLYVIKPKLRLIRQTDGQWNWLKTAFQTTEGATPPEIEIEHATVVAEFQFPDKPSQELQFKNFNVTARPADANHLSIQLATQITSLAGLSRPLMLKVHAALDGSTWKCESHDAWRVPVDRNLIQLLSDLSPQVSSQVAEVGIRLDKLRAMQTVAGLPMSPASSPMHLTSQRNPASIVPDFGARCEFDLTFRVEKTAPNLPLDFQAHAAIASGEITNGLLPFPLNEMGGEIYVDNRKIIITALKAASGETKIIFDGNVIPSKPMTATIKVRGVELNEALKIRLPEGLRKVANQLGLTGLCDADATVTQNGGGWDYQVDLFLTNGTLTHKLFPLTVHDVTGDLHIKDGVLRRGVAGDWHNHGGTLKFHGTGKHSGQTAVADGVFQNLGPEQQAEIVIVGKNLPVDEESIAACPIPVRTSIEALNLKGRHDVLLRVTRRLGLDQKWEPELVGTVYNGSLSFNRFPYDIHQLTGTVKWKGDLVEFNELSGVHNGAKLTGRGRFHRVPSPGFLELMIEAKDADFDRSLEVALPETLQPVWNQFQPHGNFDATAAIAWVPGSPCIVKLPKVKVSNGEVTMRCFPWSLHNLAGQFSYNMEPGKLEIIEVRAQHEATQLGAKGVGWFTGREPWRLDFSQLNVDSLIPDATFRKSLPDLLQKPFDFLQPTGNYSMSGRVVIHELPGQNKSLGAIWKLKTVLSDCSLRAGTRIDGINGSIMLLGKWDGVDATLNGDLFLDSLSIFRQPSSQGYQITGVRGPIQFRNRRFIAGTEPAVLIPQLTGTPDESQRISGKFIDGTVHLDADVDLSKDLDYRTFVELKRGKLENYAQQYLRRRSGLAGIMNGWMNLKGKGTDADQLEGEGKLVIAPAALYDSPLFVQMLSLLKLQTPERTAFERADLNFAVGSSRFDLNRIDLQGDSLSMRGRGYVRFDGGMKLDFGVYPRQFLPNPYRWSAVNVTGTVGDPKVQSVQLPELDSTFRQFLNAFDPRKMTPQTNLFAPLTGRASDPSVR